MRSFAILLKSIAPIFVLVGVLHRVLGLGADALLGANVPDPVISDPALDSQNRFYGVAFTCMECCFFCAQPISKGT
jgi:hypothetical protein